jgi:hypothetical protein
MFVKKRKASKLSGCWRVDIFYGTTVHFFAWTNIHSQLNYENIPVDLCFSCTRITWLYCVLCRKMMVNDCSAFFLSSYITILWFFVLEIVCAWDVGFFLWIGFGIKWPFCWFPHITPMFFVKWRIFSLPWLPVLVLCYSPQNLILYLIYLRALLVACRCLPYALSDDFIIMVLWFILLFVWENLNRFCHRFVMWCDFFFWFPPVISISFNWI